jgi:hypothetical protein
VTFLLYGAEAKVKYSYDQFTNFIDLSIGVLQGAPFLLEVVVDYLIMAASLGANTTIEVGSSSRIKTPAEIEEICMDLLMTECSCISRCD